MIVISESDISVVLNELRHIREDIAENKKDIKEFKEQYRQDQKSLQEEENKKCKDCQSIKLVEQKIESNKILDDARNDNLRTHIYGLWIVLGFVAGAIFTAYMAHISIPVALAMLIGG